MNIDEPVVILLLLTVAAVIISAILLTIFYRERNFLVEKHDANDRQDRRESDPEIHVPRTKSSLGKNRNKTGKEYYVTFDSKRDCCGAEKDPFSANDHGPLVSRDQEKVVNLHHIDAANQLQRIGVCHTSNKRAQSYSKL